MSKLWPLVRAGLKSNFGLALLRYRLFKQKKDRWLVPVFALAFAGLIPFFYGFVRTIRILYYALKPMGQESAIPAVGLMAGQVLIMIFGLYYIISAFYFSRDMEMLVPLPLRPFQVVLSKFAVILANEYLTVSFIILPFMITFGVLAGGTAGYWVNAAIVYLALPVIPLAIVSVLVVVMMRFVNLSRKKDALILIGSIALIAFWLAINFLLQRADQADIGAGNLAHFFTSPDSLLNRVGARFPPSIWATKALVHGFSADGLKNLAMFLGASLLCFGAMLFLAERLFYKGAIGLSEANLRRRVMTHDEMSRRVSSGHGAVSAIFVREWRIMNRTPVFLLNGIMVSILLPAMLLMMSKSGSVPFGRTLLQSTESRDSTPVVLILALFMTICGSFNSTASSTFSREGSQFWISRIIPVAPREQIEAKFLHSYLVSVLGIVIALAVICFLFPAQAGTVFEALVLALVASVLFTDVGMMIDLARPLLDWTNPQKAVKQNLNVMIANIVEIVILTALYWGVKALLKAGLTGIVLVILLCAGLAVLAVTMHIALLRFADRRYAEIES
jgi:ABC-2 type transport system permease protein